MQQPELRLDTNGQRERERLALTSLFVKQGSTTSLGLEGLGKKNRARTYKPRPVLKKLSYLLGKVSTAVSC